MSKLLGALLALVITLSAAACSSVKPFAAKVNDVEITQSDLDRELAAIIGNEEYLTGIVGQGTRVQGSGEGTFDSGFVARVLTRQVLLELVHQELVTRKALPTAAELTAARAEVVQSVGGDEIMNGFSRSYQDILVRRSAEVTRLQTEFASAPVDDATVRRFYDENQANFAQTCVSHILVAEVGPDGAPDPAATAAAGDALRAEAGRLRAEIDGGADFAALAAANSKDARSKDQGGDLDCGPAGRFLEPFEVAMAAVAVGEVSQPVQTQFGFHLIKVTARRSQPIEEVAPEIRQQLLEPGQQQFTDFVRGSVEKARISINPRYGRFDKTADSPAVVPPDVPDPPGSGQGGGADPDNPLG